MSGRPGSALTVVLVHGAFCDPSLWSRVVAQLRGAGLSVRAPANPLRRLATDTAHIAGVARAIDGRVLLAGHAYGGAVITGAAAQVDNAVGLVYVTGYALDAGESVADVDRRFPPTGLASALRAPAGFGGVPTADVVLGPASFPGLFAADVPVPVAAALAAAQRPMARDCLTDRLPAVAWRNLPTWYLVAADDRCVHPEAQRFMARRAGSRTSETAGSHAVAVSQPSAVADVVLTAAHVVR